jgi:hypothetical protein
VLPKLLFGDDLDLKAAVEVEEAAQEMLDLEPLVLAAAVERAVEAEAELG